MNDFNEGMIFSEEEFPKAIKSSILPWVYDNLKDGYLSSIDGTKIHYHYAVHPQEKATVVFSHGFCEFVSKYHEVMYYFYQMGYSVFLLEYRGYGFSERHVEGLDKVYVKDYKEYVSDLHAFMDQIVKKESKTKEYILYAHSMGGCIAALYLEKYPDEFKKAILSSPLFKMELKDMPEWGVRMVANTATLLGKGKKFAKGQKGFDQVPVHATSSSMSKTRYDYVFSERMREPHYTTYGGTYGWVRATLKAIKRVQRNASKIKIPVLVFQAGKDTMVNGKGQADFCSKVKSSMMIRYPESKHEIFNASDKIRKDYYRRIFDWIS